MDCISLVKAMSKLALIAIAVLFASSALIAHFLDSLNTANDLTAVTDSHRFKQKRLLGHETRDQIVIDDRLKHTFWFMQVCITHVLARSSVFPAETHTCI